MRKYLSRLRWRRYVRFNQASQGLVEYGMIVAVVGVVSLLGLNVLTQAQQGYWEALPSLAAPTPQTGTWVHSTQITMSPSCPLPSAGFIEGAPPLSCTATVTDIWGDPFETSAPAGSVLFTFDAVQTLCPLVAAPAVSPYAPNHSSCTFTRPWSLPADLALLPANPNLHHLSASYATPNITSNHHPSAWGPATYTIDPLFRFQFTSCTNQWQAGWPYHVEVGHPLNCTLTVTDQSAGTPFQGINIGLGSNNPPGLGGDLTLTCFANGSYTTLNSCPQPTSAMACTTDANGQCQFIYRRAYDGNFKAVGTDQLMATATDYTPPNHVVQSSTTFSNTPQPVQVDVPQEAPGNVTSGHPTGTIVQCTTVAAGFSSFLDDAAHSVPVQNLVTATSNNRVGESWPVENFTTAQQVKHPGGLAAFSCTAFVFDGDPNPVFDANGACGRPPAFCNPDTAMAWPPLGRVSFVDTTSHVVYGWCWLGHPGAVRPTFLNPVFTAPLSVPFLSMPSGQPEYASWCQAPVQFNTTPGPFPAGNTLPGTTLTMQAIYEQEPSDARSPAQPGHAASISPNIDMDFN